MHQLRARFAGSPEEYSDGLRAWLNGEDTDEADAAGAKLCRTLSMAEVWLRAQFKG